MSQLHSWTKTLCTVHACAEGIPLRLVTVVHRLMNPCRYLTGLKRFFCQSRRVLFSFSASCSVSSGDVWDWEQTPSAVSCFSGETWAAICWIITHNSSFKHFSCGGNYLSFSVVALAAMVIEWLFCYFSDKSILMNKMEKVENWNCKSRWKGSSNGRVACVLFSGRGNEFEVRRIHLILANKQQQEQQTNKASELKEEMLPVEALQTLAAKAKGRSEIARTDSAPAATTTTSLSAMGNRWRFWQPLGMWQDQSWTTERKNTPARRQTLPAAHEMNTFHSFSST